jgi:hypothetical protein
VDFCVTKGILQDFAVAKSCFDLSFDHSLILITLTADALNHENESILSNSHTNWDDFTRLVNERLTLNIPRNTLKQQPNSLMIQFIGQVGMQRRNIKGHSRHTTAP